MKEGRSQMLIARERRSYLFASLCSAIAALCMFYKLFQNDLYLKILEYVWFSIVIGLLILGNIVHGFFAFKSYNSLNDDMDVEGVKSIKKAYYKSFLINFLTPYFFLIVLFIAIKEYAIAFLAMALFLLMIVLCYYFDLKPTMRLKK